MEISSITDEYYFTGDDQIPHLKQIMNELINIFIIITIEKI